jgi:hypothetical protein
MRLMSTVQGRTNHNKATCALVNKLARICYATLPDGEPYGQPATRQKKKLERTAFALPGEPRLSSSRSWKAALHLERWSSTSVGQGLWWKQIRIEDQKVGFDVVSASATGIG